MGDGELPAETDTHCVVALDVGGTNIRGGVVGFPSARCLVRETVPTLTARSGEAVLASALELARSLMQRAAGTGLPMIGIGVGVAELVDLEGNVTSGLRIPWRGLPIRRSFSDLAPTLVESDVRAGALGEAFFGAGRQFRIFAYVTVGTGIAHSLVVDGEPYAGARGNALILASSPLTTVCTECGAVLRPVLDDLASGPALVSRYNRLGPARAVHRAEEVVSALERGDGAAHLVVTAGGEALGTSVGFLVNVVDPEAIIVGGGLGLAGGLYWDSFVSSTRAHIWSDTNRGIPILPAALGIDAGVIGAAARVWQRAGS